MSRKTSNLLLGSLFFSFFKLCCFNQPSNAQNAQNNMLMEKQRRKESIISYPWGELLGEGLSEGRGEVVVLWTVVDLVSSPEDGHLWRRLQRQRSDIKREPDGPNVTRELSLLSSRSLMCYSCVTASNPRTHSAAFISPQVIYLKKISPAPSPDE